MSLTARARTFLRFSPYTSPLLALLSIAALAPVVGLATGCTSETSIGSGSDEAWRSDPTPAPSQSAQEAPSGPPRQNADPSLPGDPDPTADAGPPALDPADFGDHPEVVHVYMGDRKGRGWYCTGTLISPTEVITAAHCLDPSMFVRWEIVAPNVVGEPRIEGASVRIFGGTFEDVANPDLGIMTLTEALALPTYAELTDVVASVDAGDLVKASAIVRTVQDPSADFAPSAVMPVTSTVQYGYEHGFGTPMFSKGGDSGAGLFLVENGALTHRLIGVARQPEPSRNLDHFTRIDAEMLAWKVK